MLRYIHTPGIDEPLSIERDGTKYYYHADALRSIIALADTSETVVESYSYTTFAEVIGYGSTVNNTYTFTSREWDTETGLYFYRARYYDPNFGRLISRHPIGFAGGYVNVYN